VIVYLFLFGESSIFVLVFRLVRENILAGCRRRGVYAVMGAVPVGATNSLGVDYCCSNPIRAPAAAADRSSRRADEDRAGRRGRHRGMPRRWAQSSYVQKTSTFGGCARRKHAELLARPTTAGERASPCSVSETCFPDAVLAEGSTYWLCRNPDSPKF